MKKVLEFLFAVTFGSVLLVIGLIANMFFWKKGKVLKTIFKTLREIGKLFLDFLEQIAIYIDRMGNVILENLFEVFFVQKEFRKKTLFGKSEVTISASLGHSLECIYLNSAGVKFANLLDKVLGKNHCKDAYQWYLIKKEYNKNKKIEIL